MCAPLKNIKHCEKRRLKSLFSDSASVETNGSSLCRKRLRLKEGCVSRSDPSQPPSEWWMPAKAMTQRSHQRAQILAIRGNYVMQTQSSTPTFTERSRVANLGLTYRQSCPHMKTTGDHPVIPSSLPNLDGNMKTRKCQQIQAWRNPLEHSLHNDLPMS